jgi:hypothetical protein
LDDGLLPEPAGNPFPANQATNVPLNVTLSWSAGEGATSHDVYFGTDSNAVATATHASAEFKGNGPAASFQPGVLPLNSSWYWSITEVNASGQTPGPVWHFTATSIPPPVRVEAENSLLSGGVLAASDHPGYSGTGFADYPAGTGTNVAVKFTATLPSAAARNLVIRASNGGGTARSLQLRVNGVVIQNTVNFPTTGNFDTWEFVTLNAVSFLSGTNTVDLIATQTAGPNVDYIEIQ